MIRSFDQIDSTTLARYRADPAAFIEECLVSPYDGRLYKLVDAERQFIKFAFQLDEDGRLRYPLLIYSAVKKSRKTELAAILTYTLILLFGGKFAEALILANDQAQAVNRCFTACRRIAEATPLLRNEVVITQDKVFLPATQSSIIAVASDYAGIAGGHPTISVHDELWGATSERARRLWDETIPVPTRKISCRLVTSHAGFEGEGHLLRGLCQRGLQLPLVGDSLYAGDGMLMHWSHVPLHHWQDEKWLAQMRRELRPNQYARMIENRFVSAETSFINPDLWDACVDPRLGHKVTDLFLSTWAAVDASVKHDSTALALVSWSQQHQRVELCDHRIFTPSPEQPIDFTGEVEQTLIDWHRRFDLKVVWFDPHQMAASSQRLLRHNVRMEEFPQSMPNLTAMGENLFNLIKGRNLQVYPDEQIRTAVLRAIAVEGNRGWKIDKAKQSHHIDIVIALGMAALAAVRAQGESSFDQSWRWVNEDDSSQTDPKAQAKKEADDYYAARLQNYLRMHGAFGWP